MTMSTLITILGIGVVFYLMRKSGGGCCGGHGSSGDGTDHEHPPKKPDFLKNETEKDPVCSMTVGNHSIVSRHVGQTFYFCSEQCRKIFDLNPNKYVKT